MLISNFITSGLMSVLLFIDGIIYNFIRYIYEIFIFLAKINLFSEDDYNGIVQRIYIILGVVMLFVMAYSLLKAVINPDDFAKGDTSFPNLIKNVVISLVIITVLPTIFTVAFNIQAAVLNSDVIPKIILADSAFSSDDITQKGGNTIAFNTFKAFFRPDEDFCRSKLGNNGNLSTEEIEECAGMIEINQSWVEAWFAVGNPQTLKDVYNNVLEFNDSFINFAQFSDAADDRSVEYTAIISTLVGLALFILILSYCIDLATRVIKLMFFQIIAPIPVICRVLPGDKKKVFDSWMKETLSTFLEVFVRVAIMYLGVFMITLVVEKARGGLGGIPGLGSLGVTQQMLVVVFLIVGIVFFIRQAPKLLKDVFGFDTGGTMQSLKNLMSTTAFLGGTVGAGATAMTRNAANALTKRKGLGKLTALTSAAAGLVSGAVRGGYNARNAKNFKDMRNAASAGAKGAIDARDRREAYRATHGGFWGSMEGHVQDMGQGIVDWATGGTAALDAQIKKASEYKGAFDAIDAEAQKLLDKNSSDTRLVETNVDFKGDDATKARLAALFQEHSGESLALIDKYIKGQEAITDFSSYVDKNAFAGVLDQQRYDDAIAEEMERIAQQYYGISDADARRMATQNINAADYTSGFDAEGYQKAIDAKAREHAQKVADLNNMYAQLTKASKQKIIDAAMQGETIGEISPDKAANLINKGQEFIRKYKLDGSSVTKVDYKGDAVETFNEISTEVGAKTAKQMDDIKGAFESIGSYASAEKAKHREKANKDGK